jgi:hypothetical protein
MPVDRHDADLTTCLNEVVCAIDKSMELAESARLTNSQKSDQRELWFYVGETFMDSPTSGVNLPERFIDAATRVLQHELRAKGKGSKLPSVSPWDGLVLGLEPGIILDISKAYARKHKISAMARLNEIGNGKLVIVYISPDLLDHSTAHIITSEILEMQKIADVWILCIASQARLDSMDPMSPYRKALKTVLGSRFLERGHLSDTTIAAELEALKAHVVVQVGFHQDADRPAILSGAKNAIVVQSVGHAGTSGSTRVDFILGSDMSLPDEDEKHFIEKRLIMKAPFLGNSFREFFGQWTDRLGLLRQNGAARNEVRSKLGLPPEVGLLLNISRPNRLSRRFWGVVTRVLKDNVQARLVLIDHVTAFKIRMQARFKAWGLENRLLFVPFQQLHNGSLHELIAVHDVYVDSTGFKGHTALQDALWGSSVVVSFQGKTLAERIGADLLTAFGTPENICASDDAAVVRINSLLQDRELYREARLKADKCRTDSSMYDSGVRAREILAAVKQAYDSKLQEQRERDNRSAGEKFISVDEYATVLEQLEALGVNATGTFDRGTNSLVLPAKFRGVSVDVVVGLRLDSEVHNNVIFREIQARDFSSLQYGSHAWTRALPLNERDYSAPGGALKLDAIALTVRQQVAYAIILEQPTSTAAVFFESLGQDWSRCGGKPTEALLERTIIALQAIMKLLACIHGRGRSYGGDPLDLHLFPLKDGHHKRAAAHLLHADGSTSAIMLGRATYVQDANCRHHHRPECSFTNSPLQGATPVHCKSARVARVSRRQVSNKAFTAGAEIEEILEKLPSLAPPSNAVEGILPCCGGYSCVEVAKRDDLRRAADVILNAVLGAAPARASTDGRGAAADQGGADLYAKFLSTLDQNAFRHATGHSIKDSLEEDWGILKTNMPKFANLLELLARMLSRHTLTVTNVMGNELFQGIVVPSTVLLEGLHSAPEDRRPSLVTCPALMKALEESTQHYFVKGKTITWTRGEAKKLMDVWLCYSKSETGIPFRSVRAAEPGELGYFAAIYDARVEKDEASISRLDVCYLLKFPNTGGACIDGKDRGIVDAPNLVEASTVGMFLNSCKDALNCSNASKINCARLWDPPWKTFGSDRSVVDSFDDRRMALQLTRPVKVYEELVYGYDWRKSEEVSGKRDFKQIIAQMERLGGGGTNKGARR